MVTRMAFGSRPVGVVDVDAACPVVVVAASVETVGFGAVVVDGDDVVNVPGAALSEAHPQARTARTEAIPRARVYI
jgi:hypothetical protein